MSGFYEDKIDMIFARAKSPSSIQNVELIFPHKNCRIDSLLSPKAFVHARRYTSDGVEQISHIHQDDNLLIKGDNLFALASLQEKYRNQVRMIYWDVPYNTGSLSFSYNDNLERSSWLLFIKNRVEQALPLLKEEDGVFLIQCSFHQYAHLKVLLDEIIKNYIMTFHVLVRHPDRTLTGDKEYNDVIEYILVYSKSPDFRMPKKTEKKKVDDYRFEVKELTEGKPVDFDGRCGRIFLPGEYELIRGESSSEKFKVMTVRGSIREKVSSGRFYVKYLQPLEESYPGKTLFKVEGIGDDMYDYRYFYLPPPGNKNGAYLQGMPVSSSVTRKPYPNFLDFVQSYNRVNHEGNVTFRNGKKPEALLRFFTELFTREKDLVMDAFGGSGTTAAVALKTNRRFILCEQMDFIESVTVKRLQGVLEEEATNQSFVYFELARLNQGFTDGMEFTGEEETGEVTHPYIDYEDLERESFGLTKEEIDLNRDFYGCFDSQTNYK